MAVSAAPYRPSKQSRTVAFALRRKDLMICKTPPSPFAAFVWRACSAAATTIAFSMMALPAMAQNAHHQHGTSANSPPPVFVASTAKPFSALMGDAMAVMEDGMKRAPMNGAAEHDFLAMMIPHHQGAIDMAKAVLLYSTDPEVRNLAQGIITEQQNEIRVMQAWLQRFEARQSGVPKPPR
jgi:hypothetical protein